MKHLTYHTTSTGLRHTHLHVPRAGAAHFGVAVRAGSRDERTPDEYGLAHFVEHTLFKGTQRRSAWHILNRMEAVGGELGAFTTKEDTVIYTTFPGRGVSRAVELITDLVTGSRFPEKEIDRERDVICDEINSYLDSPAEAVFDEFEDRLYNGRPLGHNILGTVESVRSITGEMCRDWLRRHYVADNMVTFYAGPLPASSFLKRALPFLDRIPSHRCSSDVRSDESRIVSHSILPAFDEMNVIDSHQSHTVLGCALPRPDVDQRIALALLTNMLGGPGMNSIFNVELRERRGLVYNIESMLMNWTDGTMFATYFGCDPDDTDRCIELVQKSIARLAESATRSPAETQILTPRRLAAAKKQYLGQMLIARENNENRVTSAARALLLHGQTMSVREVTERLSTVTPEVVATTAAQLQPLSRLTLGPNPL